MKFWLASAWTETQHLTAVAQFAEDVGFYGIMNGDHAVYPTHIAPNYPYSALGGTVSDILTDADLRLIEKNNTQKALAHCGGKIAGKSGAAALLGLKPSTLTYRMQQLGLK